MPDGAPIATPAAHLREPQNILPAYLDGHERLSYHATKIVYNCLIADRFASGERPVPSDFAHAWPAAIWKKVLDNWQAYGFRHMADRT